MRESALRALLLVVGISLAGACVHGSAVRMPREVHGMSDAFAAPGAVLAWAVVRQGNDADVVIRIVANRTSYPWVAVSGSDPFTQSKQQVFPATRSSDVTDVRARRAHFAGFPRTEVRFYESAAAAQADRPALVVFFLGVPDTVPEFATEAQLQSYLGGRVARLLNPSG